MYSAVGVISTARNCIANKLTCYSTERIENTLYNTSGMFKKYIM
jgi:hypothetical protein